MNRLSYFSVFVLAVGLIGCEPPADPNASFPPIAKSDPLPAQQTGSSAGGASSQSVAVQPGPIDPDAPEEFTTTESGLKYRIRRKSDGRKPTATDEVDVHYKGWFDDGKPFDSSYDRGKVFHTPLNQVIKGWTEGMQLVGEGGMIELEVPYQLGYGEDGGQGIPPKKTLHFLVEMLKVR